MHKTYHHFTNYGLSDSSIDVVLSHTPSPKVKIDKLLEVLCSKTSDVVDSKHDILITAFETAQVSGQKQNIDKAPSITNTKHKIKWTQLGIASYESFVSPVIEDILNIPIVDLHIS